MFRWRQWLLLLFALLIVSSAAFTAGVEVERSGLMPGAVRVEPSDINQQFSVFWQAWELVHQHFVDRSAVSNQSLTYGAIQGMVDALGDTGHTRFLNPEEASFQLSDIAGKFDGIGAQIGERDGYPMIVSPLDGSPAEKAGIKAGDIIVQVNGQSVAGLSTDKIVSLVRGPKGTSVTLTVIHQGETALTDITVQRDTIQVHPVSWAMIPGTNVAHLRISEFSATANQELMDALKAIRAAGGQSVVLDVRNNPGGLLDQAVSVSSQFLTSGNVLVEQDANGERKPTPVLKGGQAPDIPMVVLVNLGSASAAEIFAGAMQDQKRAQLVGDTTFGTGTVLTPFSLSDGSMLLLGTSQWLTPSGRQIWKQGVTPDVKAPLPTGTTPLTPAREKGMTADQVRASNDTQLLKAVDLLAK